MDDETRLPDEEALRWTRLATRSRDRTHIGTEVDSISVHDERFALGAIFAGRFRIVARLGKGGMGEVYRADDLKLGQAVALKLLPDRLARDPARLAQFHNEVRLARTISHRNVCRTYDIGDDNGTPFLTMEYVDGDDLASLLRRIGRSPRTRPSKSRARSAPASRPRTSAECFSTPRDSIDRRSTTSLLAGCRELKPTYARPGKDESPNWPTHRYGSKRQRTAVGLVFFIVVLPWTQPTRMARPGRALLD